MRALLQRVSSACVTIDGRVTGQIERGLLVLLGIHKDDTEADCNWISRKILDCRIFPDNAGRMNRCITSIRGAFGAVAGVCGGIHDERTLDANGTLIAVFDDHAAAFLALEH